jgi:hypothetical protein
VASFAFFVAVFCCKIVNLLLRTVFVDWRTFKNILVPSRGCLTLWLNTFSSLRIEKRQLRLTRTCIILLYIGMVNFAFIDTFLCVKVVRLLLWAIFALWRALDQVLIPFTAVLARRFDAFSCRWVKNGNLRSTRASVVFFVISMIGLTFFSAFFLHEAISLPFFTNFVDRRAFYEFYIPRCLFLT